MHIGLGDIILTGASTLPPVQWTPGADTSVPVVAPITPINPFNPADLAQIGAYYAATVPPAYPGGPWRTPAQKAANDATLAMAVTGKGTPAPTGSTADRPAAGTAAGSQQNATAEPGFLSKYGLLLVIGGGVGALLLMKGK